MAGRNSVLRGSPIVLTAIFLDAGGTPVNATNLKLSIFPPGFNPENGAGQDDAWVWEATTSSGGSGPESDPETMVVNTSAGHYSYTFIVPTDSALGAAFDNWQGTVDSQDLNETLSFTIVGGGSIGVSTLYNNNVVFIRLDSSIANTDGVELGEDYEWFFTTTYEPLYASVRRVRLDLGLLIKDVPDDTINLAIFEAGLEANSLTFGSVSLLTSDEQSFYDFARRQYVTCLAELIILTGLEGTGGGATSKQLADLTVKWDAGKVGSLPDKVRSCVAKWEDIISSGGELGPGTSHKPSMVIKGLNDPDRPNIGRGWESTYGNSERGDYPAANAKELPYSWSTSEWRRRWRRTYQSSRWSSRFDED